MSLPFFQEAFNQLLTYCVRHHVTHVVADTVSMPLLSNDEQTWLSDVWLPRARCLEVAKLAFILPGSVHNQLVVEHFLQAGQFCLNTKVQFFSDGPAALDWLTRSFVHAADLEQEWHRRHFSGQTTPYGGLTALGTENGNKAVTVSLAAETAWNRF